MQPIRNRNPLPVQATINNRRNRGRLRVRDLYAHKNKEVGQVLDLSATGMRVRYRAKTHVAKDEQIALTLKWNEVSVSVRAKVVWVQEYGAKDKQVGVRFENLNPNEAQAIRQLAVLAADSAMKGA